MVLVSGSELIEDIRKAPDDVLSLIEAISDVRITYKMAGARSKWLSQFLQTDYTLNWLNKHDDYHADVVRSKLTRNIAVTFKDVREELIYTLEDSIPTGKGNTCWSHRWKSYLLLIEGAEWVKVPIMETLQQAVCSSTNRAFVGVPLCSWSPWYVGLSDLSLYSFKAGILNIEN
jgi:hypothetical protein